MEQGKYRELADRMKMPEDMDRRLKMKLIKEAEQKQKKKAWNRYAMTAAIALCFIVALSGAAVAKSDLLRNWLAELGPNSKNVEEYIETDTAKTDSDWLTVKDVYLDGMKLVFVVELQEGSQVMPYDITDHSYVDGVDCLSYSFQPIGDGMYEGIIDLSVADGLLQSALSKDTITVETTLYCEGDATTDRREFTFTVPSKNMQLTTMTEGDKIPITEIGENGEEIQIGTVVGTFTISPSTIQMRLHYEFTGENAKENREKYAAENLLYNVIDDAGQTMDFFDVCNWAGYENIVDRDGFSSIDITAELNKYDTNSKTITLYPVTVDYYTEGELAGKYIQGTEVPHEERAITFHLQ